jgi:hypothetical protein
MQSFIIGLTAGVPIGVYLRDNDYRHKLREAFYIMYPNKRVNLDATLDENANS